MKPAVFLDRDGVVITATHLVTKMQEVEIEKNAPDAIRIFNDLGFKVIIVTNQPQVARGLCTEEDVIKINKNIKKTMEKDGAIIDDIYFCPHHPEMHEDVPEYAKKYRIDCRCRKPKTGMILEAAKKHDIDLSKSFMIGDRTVDAMTGKNAGIKTILVKTGRAGMDGKYDTIPDHICADLMEAAKLIKRSVTTKAVILAGGKGERLMPLTKDIPKPMIEISGKPVLQHHIGLLKKYGINEIIVCASYLIDKIKDFFGNGKNFGVQIYYPDEPEQLGTGGAIKNAEQFIKGCKNFIVLNGDVVTNINLSALLDFHETKDCLATIVVRKSDHPIDSDIVQLDENRVIRYIGRGQKKHKVANTGIMILKASILGHIKKGVSNIETDVVFRMLDDYKICAYFSNDYIKDMGTFDRLEKVRREFSLIS